MNSTMMSKPSFYDNLEDSPEQYESIINTFLKMINQGLKVENFTTAPYQIDTTLDYIDYYKLKFSVAKENYNFIVFNESYLDSHVFTLILNKILSKQEKKDSLYFIDANNDELIFYANETKHEELISDHSCNALPDSKYKRLDGYLFIHDNRFDKIYKLNKFKFDQK